jgi:hypothetical protein
LGTPANYFAGEFINRPLHAIARGEIDRSGQSQTNRLAAAIFEKLAAMVRKEKERLTAASHSRPTSQFPIIG